MYEELVHDLRLHHDTVVETYSQDGINITETVYSKAADAIEELSYKYQKALDDLVKQAYTPKEET